MNESYIKERIDTLYAEMRQLIESQTDFVSIESVIKHYEDEIQAYQEQCCHNFNNGVCTICRKKSQ